MKKIATFILTATLLFSGCKSTSLQDQLTEVSDKFFNSIITSHEEEAYNLTASAFQENTSAQQFLEFVNDFELTEYQSSIWTQATGSENQAMLNGTITRKDQKIKTSLQFKMENSEWKILAIGMDTSLIEEITFEEERVNTTVKNILYEFVDAVNADDFNNLYNNHVAQTWKNNVSPEDFSNAFQKYIDEKPNWAYVKESDPEIVQKHILENGKVLFLNGTFPVPRARVISNPAELNNSNTPLNFIIELVQEDGELKLKRIEVAID